MELHNIHFENTLWLWALLLIPLLWVFYGLFYKNSFNLSQLEAFIDKSLLPHLLINKGKNQRIVWKSLLLWSMLWALLIGALAGPRWDYHEIETFSPDQKLIILLDLSRSMDVKDVKPSRLARARQKIEDLLNLAQGVKIGLIAFAATPHMIAPLTDDKETLRNLLPSLGTDLVYVQGSKLSPALIMASRLLESVPGNNKSLLIITDGGFEDSRAIKTAQEMAQKGIIINTLGVATEEGGPIQDVKGNFIKKQEEMVISKLEKDKLQELSRVGNGQHLQLHYSDEDIRTLLNQIREKTNTEEKAPHKIRQWEERFYVFLLPLMAALLFWFRKGFIFPIILLFLSLSSQQTKANSFHDFFKNDSQLGKEALERGDYEIAIQKFTDPYHQGVTQYKAGHFAEAERLFRQSERPEVATEAAYNLGNALAQQQKLEEAVNTYEKVLEKNPNHIKAKHNLEIVKRLLEQQKKQEEQQEERNQQGNADNKSDQNQQDQDQNQNNESKDDSEPKPSQNSQGQNSEQSGQNLDRHSENEKSTQQSESMKNTEKDSPLQKEEKGEEQRQEGSENQMQNDHETHLTEGEKHKERGEFNSKSTHSQEDMDADQWLNRIINNPTSFLKNQFYIESQQNGPLEETEPW